MSRGVRSSAGLVWRHRRLLWWIFAMNLATAWLASLPVHAVLRNLLDHSLGSARLVTGFDVGAFVLLLEQPEVQLRSMAPVAVGSALLFLLGMLAINGGLLREYLEDRKLRMDEFFATGGAFFWRMVRLALYSLVPFAALIAGAGALSDYLGKLTGNLPQAQVGFFVNAAVQLLVALAALLVRIWFDVAQARVVHGDEGGVLHTLWRSFVPAVRSGLFWRYLGIALFAAASFAGGLWLWAMLPHRAMAASFAVLELVTLAQIGARLWMKAATARWVALQSETVAWQAATLEATLATVAAGPAVNAPQPE